MATNGSLNRKLRMALVGGGLGAFIGRVHVTAAVLDNRASLVAGAFSSSPEKSKASAPDYDVPLARAYGSVDELLAKERALPADQRIDFVTVATPNHTHFPIAKAALEAGFNVVCDKPLTFDLAQAEQLHELVKKSGAVFAVTHNYTGYPLVRQARQMIQSGELGEIQAVRVCYIQGWLRSRLESEGQKQAAWRTDRAATRSCNAPGYTHGWRCRQSSPHFPTW
ncbi:MAG: Gfo/Idh/MocA family protein, partial [Planctomycetaceae bacterium]